MAPEMPAPAEAAVAVPSVTIEMTPSAAHVLDRQVLDGVLTVLTHERFCALAARFLHECAGSTSQMAAAARSGERESLRRDAHGCKGAALNLGLKALAEAAQHINQAANDTAADAGTLERLVQAFEARLADTRTALQREGLLPGAAAIG